MDYHLFMSQARVLLLNFVASHTCTAVHNGTLHYCYAALSDM